MADTNKEFIDIEEKRFFPSILIIMETLTYTDENGQTQTFNANSKIIFTDLRSNYKETKGSLNYDEDKKSWYINFRNPYDQRPLVPLLRLDLTSEKMEDLTLGYLVIKKNDIGGRSRRRRNKRRTRRLR